MRLLIGLLLAARLYAADWKDTQLFYYFDGHIAGVAITTNVVHSVQHVASLFSSVQIGNSTGVLPSYCTTFTSPSSPCGSIQNCQWIADHVNVTFDAYQFITCRPVTNGITYVATNLYEGRPIVWWSDQRHTWLSGSMWFYNPISVETYADGSTAQYGTFAFYTATPPIEGDSGSPAFTIEGDFIGSIGQTMPGAGLGSFAIPSNARYRPATSVPKRASNFGAYFNHDTD